MANALDYLKWRGDISFEHSAFNEIDSFICSQLSTPDYTDIVSVSGQAVRLDKVVKEYFKRHKKTDSLGALQSTSIMPLLETCEKTTRFGKEISLQHAANRIIQENTEQFCAVTLILPDNSIVVSYRGTDDTLIGWKEDCELATEKAVPAQKDAADYLAYVASIHPGQIRLCGHSKGGNLAISAASSVSPEIRKRIVEVYNFDGPGFNVQFLTSEGYLEMKDRITTVISQNSVVGLLLNQVGRIEIVNSTVSGPLAHDGFYWLCEGRNFIKCTKLSSLSETMDKALKTTIEMMSDDEKHQFIEELFGILMSRGSITITDFINLKKTEIAKIVIELNNGKKVQGFIHQLMKELSLVIKDNTGKSLEEIIQKLPRL